MLLASPGYARTLDLPVRRAGQPEAAAPAYLGDRLTIRLQPWASRAVPVRREARGPLGLSGPDLAARALGGAWFEPEFKGEVPPPEGSARTDFTAFYVVHLPADADLAGALDRFASLPEVAGAEPTAVAPVTAVPNDSLWAISDWFYHPPTRRDIHAPEAWDISTGDTSIVVAIVDTGLMPYHPDLGGTVPGLPGNVWTNWAERGGLPGVDDDHNGFVDDIWGWDFVDLPPTAEVRPGEDGFDAEGDPNDFVGHGTAVAGIVGAIANNGSGVAGTVWQARLMAVRAGWASVQQPSGEVSMLFAAQAIRYATRMGARVINCSFSNLPSYDLDVAISGAVAAGVLVVIGSGNYGSPNAAGPRPDVITVGAVDKDDVVAPWSNNAPWVDLCAPGTSVATTAIRRPGTDSLGVRQPGYVPDAGGTSFSAPFVSGAAALVQARRRALGLPLLDAMTLLLHLRETTDDISAQNPAITGFGAGRLNLEAALARAGTPASRVVHTPGRLVGDPILLPRPGGNRVVMVTENARMLVVDEATGAPVQQVVLPGRPVAGLAAADLGRGNGTAMFVPLTGGRVAGYYPGGDPRPGWPVTSAYFPGGFTRGVALGDVDGDGALEVIGAGPSGIQVWRADGSTLFRWASSVDEEVSAPVALADLDGRPGMEIIVGTRPRNVYALSGNGSVLNHWPVRLDGSGIYGAAAPVVTRFGHDPSPTIVVADGSYLHALRADGSLRFRVPLWDNQAKDPALADLNGDGSDEVVVASGSNLAAFDSSGAMVWQPVGIYRPYTQDVPVVGTLGAALDPMVVIRSARELTAFDRGGRVMRGFPKPGLAGPYPSITERSSGVAAELMAGTDGDSLLFLYDLGSGTGSEAPQPWPMPRGNLARTGSRIGPGAISPLDTVPPSPVADLAATVSGLGIDLTWTAPADVGTPPHASSYEMRWALVPLDEASFESGSPVTVLQAPGGAGQPEHLRLTGFAEARTYYFALKSRDPGWNLSPISNLATVAIPAIPPARIGDLRAVVVRDSSVMLQWTASGDDSLVGRPRRYNVRGAPQPLDPAGFPTAPIQADAFPTGEGSGWSEHLVLTGLPIGQPLWFAIEAEDDLGLKAPISNLAAVPAPVLRPARVGDLSVFAVIDGGIELNWTAVGDDSLLGSAARYLLRATPTPLDSAGFDTAPLTREIPPLSPGETVRYLLTGLAVGQPLSFGVKAEDDLGLRSALSNVVGLTFRGVPPARVTDLRVETAVDSGVVLRWPESGDDGTLGRASRYLLAADTTALDDSTFDAARFRLEVERGARGVQRTTFRHLPTGHTMFFAVEAVDDIGSRSPISNLATALIDRIRPARVTDLTVLSYTDSSLTLSWTATGDDSLVGRPARYHLRASPDPIDETTFDQAPFAVVAPAGVDPGLAERATLQHLPAREPLYLALEVEGNDGLRSALSNLVSTAIEPRPPQAVADLATEGASENGVSFRWTASGDDGTVGQAQDYLLHGAPEPITADNFAAAPIAVTIPAARPSGSLEHGRFDQVTVGQQLWFAIKARDRAGALSALSNVVPVTVVAQAPAAVSDLRVDGTTDSSVTLSWTATGDDGSVGRPAFYELRASLAPIDEAGFDSAEPVQRTPATVDAGGIEHFRFPDLAPGRYWWIALRAVDVAHNGSTLSNLVTGRTGIGGPLSGRTGAGLAALQQPSRSPVILYWQSDAGAEQATHTIELFDLNGRCVRRLSAGPGVGGVVPWDARNENGERLPAGLYFARIVDAASRTRARILLLP